MSEVWYFVIAGAYFLLWKKDWLLDYRIQKKAAMPEPALIKVCVCAWVWRQLVCWLVEAGVVE